MGTVAAAAAGGPAFLRKRRNFHVEIMKKHKLTRGAGGDVKFHSIAEISRSQQGVNGIFMLWGIRAPCPQSSVSNRQHFFTRMRKLKREKIIEKKTKQ